MQLNSGALGRAFEIFTASKSFAPGGMLGSRRLNEWGLHVARVRAAYALQQKRRARLSAALSATDRRAFDEQGFVIKHDYLPAPLFAQLVDQVRRYRTPVKERAEGSTLLRKVPVDGNVRTAIPALPTLLDQPQFRALLAYGEGNTVEPAFYLQTVAQRARANAQPDPQCRLHRDTFHPTAKAWLYLTDVPESVGPLRYVPGSQRLTQGRLAWEKEKSLGAVLGLHNDGGAFRITEEELGRLGYGQPRALAVPANTLIVADTFGFHARGESSTASTRVEVWAIGRRSPFLSWPLDRALQRLSPKRQIHWREALGTAYDTAD